jgi:hypothetical protein
MVVFNVGGILAASITATELLTVVYTSLPSGVIAISPGQPPTAMGAPTTAFCTKSTTETEPVSLGGLQRFATYAYFASGVTTIL